MILLAFRDGFEIDQSFRGWIAPRTARGINAQRCSSCVGARPERADAFRGGNSLNRSTDCGSRSSLRNSRACSLERPSRSVPCGSSFPSLRALPAGSGFLWRPGVRLQLGLRVAAPPRTRHRKPILVAPLSRLPLRLVRRLGGRASARPPASHRLPSVIMSRVGINKIVLLLLAAMVFSLPL